jgi:transposase-like protein
MAGMTDEATDDAGIKPGRQRRPRRTGAEIEAVLADFRQSGQTVAAYARAHGVPEPSLRAWLAWRARRERTAAQATAGFAPVRVVSRVGQVRSAGNTVESPPGGLGEPLPAIRLRWPSGLEARVEAGVDPAWAAAVLRGLEGLCSA